MENNKSILKEKSYNFSLRIVKLYKFLCDEKKEFVISKQILRSGTSVGAMIREGEYAQSKLDFVNKMSVALKEINETGYWLDLLKDSGYLSEKEYISLYSDYEEIIKMLISTVKTSKK
ncbi:MAG: four helix bundle protein [Candidatus Gracilibacteria bacterium]|nr:four helix bundle protein [Candidatus Gracilibacteria bacterium]